MGRSRYKIYEPTHPHFLTCTILHWIPHAYVILENHIHIVAQSDDIAKSMAKFKRHTARALLKLLQERNVKTILDQLEFYKKAHKSDRLYQVWQEGLQPKLIQNDAIMINKINYIHQNPIKRGYVDKATHWRYSSARDYEGINGLLEIERFW